MQQAHDAVSGCAGRVRSAAGLIRTATCGLTLKDACESVDMMIATLPESTFLRRGSLSSTRSTSDESSDGPVASTLGLGSEMLAGSDAPPTEADLAGTDAPPTEPDFVTVMLCAAAAFCLDMN